MKNIILTLSLIIISTNSFATTPVADALDKLNNAQTNVENKLNTKAETTIAQKNEMLAKIDAQIAKAKEEGKSTTKLEEKRQEILDKIAKKQNEVNNKINSLKYLK